MYDKIIYVSHIGFDYPKCQFAKKKWEQCSIVSLFQNNGHFHFDKVCRFSYYCNTFIHTHLIFLLPLYSVKSMTLQSEKMILILIFQKEKFMY